MASIQRQFSRPVEYDPTLASKTLALQQKSRTETMANDLGFESDSDKESSNKRDNEEASGSDNDNIFDDDGKSERKKKNRRNEYDDQEDEEDANDELERMAEAVQEANESRLKAEANALKLEQRIEELRTVSEKAKLIMKEKFTLKIKALMTQIEEQKAIMEEDDENITDLREQLTRIEQKGDEEQVTIHMREFRDSRTLGRENISLRYRIDELSQQIRNLKDENEEMKKSLLEARALIKMDQKENIDDLTEKVATLEADKESLKEELKRRFIERSKMAAKINKLQERLGESIPLDDIDEDSSKNNNQMENLQQKEEIEKLRNEIKNLKEALKNATRPIIQAPSISKDPVASPVSSPTPAPVPAPVPTPSPSATSAPASSASAAEVEQLKRQKAELEEMIRKTDALMKRREEEMNLVKSKAKEKLTTASQAISKLKEEYNKLRDQYNRAKSSSSGVENELRTRVTQSIHKRKRVLSYLSQSTNVMKQELTSVKTQLHNFQTNLISSLAPMLTEQLQKFNDMNSAALNDIKDKYAKEMKLRKQLFNQIQELKGNIRVYCRVRPMNDRERSSEGDECITFPSAEELSITNPENKTSHSFEFEKIFRPTGTTQESVFTEIQELVTSCLDGYNVCIFAYGQTGSGKTFTMQGPPENPGVNVRALAMLFAEAASRAPDIEYDIQISLLEIYNEDIKDLLGDTSKKLKCVQGKDGQEVPDLTMVSVSSKEEVLSTLALGSKNRHVTATNMNAVSSRSHLILSVYVAARNNITRKETKAKLHLIDLAGSERVGRSGVEGVALKEAQNINQSLSSLGNCIHARANKADHVPYRNSTLTWLLKDSLEKNSKTLMFVQVSPMLKDASESVCSLKFAARVREVELGKATKNEKAQKA